MKSTVNSILIFLFIHFSPGNILQTEQGFALVDTNRMRHGTWTIRQGLRNMAGLWLQPEVADQLAAIYVRHRGIEAVQPYIDAFRHYRKDFWQHFMRRHHLKDVIVHRDLDGSQYTYHFNTTIR